jgi:hypothetical protein
VISRQHVRLLANPYELKGGGAGARRKEMGG